MSTNIPLPIASFAYIDMNLLGMTYFCATNVDCTNQNWMHFEGSVNILNYKENNDMNAFKDFGTISPIYYCINVVYLLNEVNIKLQISFTHSLRNIEGIFIIFYFKLFM